MARYSPAYPLAWGRGLHPSSLLRFWWKVDATGWLGHISAILKGSNRVVELVTREQVGVLIHCSDGWDRTAQLCSLAQMCIDPYYRTIQGLQVRHLYSYSVLCLGHYALLHPQALIEKDWLGFGHKFKDRCAHSTNQASEERSPIFTLFMDCIWQIMRQFPTVLEFNEELLIALLDHLYSCRYGTFLSNSWLERDKHLNTLTLPIWTYVEYNYERWA